LWRSLFVFVISSKAAMPSLFSHTPSLSLSLSLFISYSLSSFHPTPVLSSAVFVRGLFEHRDMPAKDELQISQVSTPSEQ